MVCAQPNFSLLDLIIVTINDDEQHLYSSSLCSFSSLLSLYPSEVTIFSLTTCSTSFCGLPYCDRFSYLYKTKSIIIEFYVFR
jgi:hypothetical protein